MERRKKPRLFSADGIVVKSAAGVGSITPGGLTPTPRQTDTVPVSPSLDSGDLVPEEQTPVSTPEVTSSSSVIQRIIEVGSSSGTSTSLNNLAMRRKKTLHEVQDEELEREEEEEPVEVEPEVEVHEKKSVQVWTLLGVTMRPLWWLVAGLATLLIVAVVVKYLNQ